MLARLRAGADRDEIAGRLRTWWLGERDPETLPQAQDVRGVRTVSARPRM